MSELRLEKLRGAVRSIQGERVFSEDWAKTQCGDLAPAYVTKILKQLAKDGHLEACKENKQTYYKWLVEDPKQVDHWIENQVYRHQIKSVPLADRPREQLLEQGAERLTDAQLLAILIRVGVPGESAVQAGLAISSRYQDRELARLIDVSLQELGELGVRDDHAHSGRAARRTRGMDPTAPRRLS